MFFGRFFLIFLFASSPLLAQDIRGRASFAPTNFSKRIEASPNIDLSQNLQEAGATFFKNSGGAGKLSQISFRGGQASDFEVSLEGISLNSVSSNEFDFGLLSSYGLEDIELIRGGYSPLSTAASGQLKLHLPTENKRRFSLGYGSYQSFVVAQEAPGFSLSLEQSENDFPYEDVNHQKKFRENNAFQRFNARAWHRFDDGQFWGQILFSDQDLAGPTFSLTPGANYQVVQPLLVLQKSLFKTDFSVWAQAQKQSSNFPTYASETENQWWSSGLKAERSFLVLQNSMLSFAAAYTQDYFRSEQVDTSTNTTRELDSPLRQTLVASTGFLWGLSEQHLIHPRLRAEFVSDLKKERFSFHPGLGARHQLFSWLLLQWNLNYVSRAPNFSEMYLETPPTTLANRNLKRQRSYQSDLGYRLKFAHLEFEQVAFANRVERLLQSRYNGSAYQVTNAGTSVAMGLENELRIQPQPYWDLTLNYTLQRVSLNDAQQAYQPTHSASFRPRIWPQRFLSIAAPFIIKSSVPTSVAGSRIPEQYDLGFEVEFQRKPFRWNLQLQNLLGWNRQEVAGFPLSNEVHFATKLAYEF